MQTAFPLFDQITAETSIRSKKMLKKKGIFFDGLCFSTREIHNPNLVLYRFIVIVMYKTQETLSHRAANCKNIFSEIFFHSVRGIEKKNLQYS